MKIAHRVIWAYAFVFVSAISYRRFNRTSSFTFSSRLVLSLPCTTQLWYGSGYGGSRQTWQHFNVYAKHPQLSLSTLQIFAHDSKTVQNSKNMIYIVPHKTPSDISYSSSCTCTQHTLLGYCSTLEVDCIRHRSSTHPLTHRRSENLFAQIDQ